MIDLVYIEEAVRDHPRTRAILDRVPAATRISCDHYGEVFNRRAQSFRLQKRQPALILANKEGRLVHETPKSYGIGHERNYYFSHMLNCVYDCRYCFLQGMFRSAHYVVFVNYDDFAAEIERTATSDSAAACFFSGYDCDSLAFEPVTGFVDHILPVFERLPNAWLELRTKSTQVRSLRLREALPNCVVAFSLSPEAIGEALEHKVPPLSKRLDVLTDLAARGWKIGLRFDPLIDCPDFHETYRELFESVFRRVPEESVHSVSLGPFRLPRDFYKTAVKQYPDEPLFAAAVEDHAGMVSYPRERERELVAFATEELAGFVPEERFFPCQLEETDSSDA